jgi:hypothetical protein
MAPSTSCSGLDHRHPESGVSAAIAWAGQIIERHESDGTPPTALTMSPESPWRWRDSNGTGPFCKSARQRHSLDSR